MKNNNHIMTINRSDLEQVMMGVKTLATQVEDGTTKLEGNGKILNQLGAMMTTFELAFEILPGTVGSSPTEELNDFEVGPVPVIHE